MNRLATECTKRQGRAFLLAVLLACAPAQLPVSRTPIDLVIATTTDVHGRITAWDYYANNPETIRGLTRAATIVDSVRAANPGRVILLDAGDCPFGYWGSRLSVEHDNLRLFRHQHE